MKKLRLPLAVAAMLVLALALSGCTVSRAANPAATAQPSAPAATAEAAAAPDPAASQASESAGAISIPVTDLSDGNAHFYREALDGVNVEVVAVKLADGSVRTAFNACQVCYDSGKGYYKQEGDLLVCQNCGNSFTMDQVGLSAGGCNPVPIGDADRLSDGANITIARNVLQKGEALFTNRAN